MNLRKLFVALSVAGVLSVGLGAVAPLQASSGGAGKATAFCSALADAVAKLEGQTGPIAKLLLKVALQLQSAAHCV
jgi:hypothetical protein